MLIGFFKNLFILLIIVGILFGVTRYVPILKKQTDTQVAKVLGAKTSAKEEETPLADSLKKDAEEQLNQAKENALQIKVADVLKTIERLQKIPRDLSAVQKGVTETIDTFISKK